MTKTGHFQRLPLISFAILFAVDFPPVFFVVCQRNTFNSPGPLIKCTNFEDQRTGKFSEDFINIPENRTSAGIYSKERSKKTVKFPMHNLTNFWCSENFTEERLLDWDYKSKKESALVTQKRFDTVEGGAAYLPQRVYFTAMGYMYDPISQVYYKPNGEYCIKSVSDQEMIVNLCVIKDDCQTAALPNTYCLPKCCAVDEVLSLPSKKCQSVSKLSGFSGSSKTSKSNLTLNTGVTPWYPPVYRRTRDTDQPFFGGATIKQHWPDKPFETSFKTSNVSYHSIKLPKTCNMVGTQQAHLKMKWDSNGDRKVPLNETVRLGVPCGARSGQIRPMLYNNLRQTWERQSHWEYCADGYFEEGRNTQGDFFTENDFNYVVIYCEVPRNGENASQVCPDPDETSGAMGSRNMLELTTIWRKWFIVSVNLSLILQFANDCIRCLQN